MTEAVVGAVRLACGEGVPGGAIDIERL